MENVELQQEWELRIAEFRASGQTQTKWCEINNFKIHQFKYWLRKIEKTPEQPKPSSKWIPITMENQFDESNESLKIKIGPASIEVKPGVDLVFFADVVRTLGSL
jgi:hypothetical protein